jgi:hypothetical protein
MRKDAKEIKRNQLLRLIELKSHKIAFVDKGNMIDVALLDSYRHLITNVDLSSDAYDYIKTNVLFQH